ncbi:hypothetical protein I4U23_009313 [Adineta vaga]|nr:hypothetical protein I4U23_009313 [Adineta vaga]
MNSALKGQLNACVQNVIRDTDMVNPSLNKHLDTYDNNDDLQSLLAFLHEQSSAASPPGPLPYHYVCDFIQYLRHFAQLGILYTPKIAYLLTDLHKAKDHDSITLITFKNKLEQMKTINYVYVYDHLNLVELYDFLNKMILDERDLRNILLPSNNNIKRIPDEVRRRLNEMILLCKKFSIDRTLLEQLFGPTMNYKLYNKMKEILKTKNLISRKQSVTAIVQMHKHFLQISSLQTQHCLTEQQLDLILQNIHDHFSEKQTYFEDIIKHMTELGYLQDKLFVDYCTQHFLSDEFFSSMVEVQNQFQTWPFILELNHSHVREVVKHLTQLELDGKLDCGTSIEIQNRLNQIARFGRWFSPRIKSITEEILKIQGKRFLSDRNGYQSIQFYRLLLNDITHAIEFELYLQELLSEHQISDRSYSYYRHFLHRILQNELNIDELTRYRTELNAFHHVKRMDIGQVKRCIDSLSK